MIARKREKQDPIEELAQSVATGVRVATTLGLMALDAMLGKLGYEVRRKDSVLVAKRAFRKAVPKPKGNAYREAAKAKTKTKAKVKDRPA